MLRATGERNAACDALDGRRHCRCRCRWCLRSRTGTGVSQSALARRSGRSGSSGHARSWRWQRCVLCLVRACGASRLGAGAVCILLCEAKAHERVRGLGTMLNGDRNVLRVMMSAEPPNLPAPPAGFPAPFGVETPSCPQLAVSLGRHRAHEHWRDGVARHGWWHGGKCAVAHL